MPSQCFWFEMKGFVTFQTLLEPVAHPDLMAFVGFLDYHSFAGHVSNCFKIKTSLLLDCWRVYFHPPSGVDHPLNNGNNNFKVMSSFEPL